MPLPRWLQSSNEVPIHVVTVRAMADAFDARDADDYVSFMTEDVVVSPPGFLMGRSELRGQEEVKAAFAKFARVLKPGRRLEVTERRHFVDGVDESRVLSIDQLRVSPANGMTSGLETFGAVAALLFTMTADGKVCKLESWPSEAEGLAQLRDPLPIDK
jgi:ketosteroid isomerase-like protein